MADNPLFEGIEDRGVHKHLGIRVVEAQPDRVVLELDVTDKTHQPFGLLHGGVSALLAESAASMGAALSVGQGQTVVGIEINASHLRGVSEGMITATATPIRKGRSIHVWHIGVVDHLQRAICDARCTLAVVSAPQG
jgi:uncharacterized protein (TIGR00369 family)